MTTKCLWCEVRAKRRFLFWSPKNWTMYFGEGCLCQDCQILRTRTRQAEAVLNANFVADKMETRRKNLEHLEKQAYGDGWPKEVSK